MSTVFLFNALGEARGSIPLVKRGKENKERSLRGSIPPLCIRQVTGTIGNRTQGMGLRT